MIIVTGGAGFIGSNVVRALNDRGRDDVLVVDALGDGGPSRNLAGCTIAGYYDREELLAAVRGGADLGEVGAIVHQGACTDTREHDSRHLMRMNFEDARELLDYAEARGIPFIYASSAAVYGTGERFTETPECERPVNPYGESKLAFDDHVRRRLGDAESQIAGLRYFNVYGPGEAHKGAMASVARQLDGQLRRDGVARLFRGSGGYADGEQRRDFVHVDDVVAVNLWFLDHPEHSGIYNVGTGRSRSFNDLAAALVSYHRGGRIEYVPFPEELDGCYQSFTEADIGALRAAGYDREFLGLEEGIAAYMRALDD